MTFLDRVFLGVILLVAYAAYRNAQEAHAHTHEIACHVGAADLCGLHKEADQ